MNLKRHRAYNLQIKKKLILYEPYSLYFVDFISKGIKVLNFRFLNIMNIHAYIWIIYGTEEDWI